MRVLVRGTFKCDGDRLDRVEEIEIINGFLPDLLEGFPRLRTYNGQIHRMVGIPTMIINTSSGSPIRQ